MKFEVGQKVWCSRTRFRNLEIISINGLEIKCRCETYHEREKNYTDGWHLDTHSFMYYELRNKPFENNNNIHVPTKWKNIIQRNPNMKTSVNRLYEDVLNNSVNINPPYQRDLVWSLEQKQKYIENLFNETAVITPTIILNWEDFKNYGEYEIIDGKQRLTTIFDFIENKFCLSNGMYFKDLSMSDCNFILYHDVRYTRIEKIDCTNLTLNQKIELFLEINELGTKVSQDHLNKVKDMLLTKEGV